MSTTLRVVIALLGATTILGVAGILSGLAAMQMATWSTEPNTDPALFLMMASYVSIALAAAAGFLSGLLFVLLAGSQRIRVVLVLAGSLMFLALLAAVISYNGAAKGNWAPVNELVTWAGPILAYDACLLAVAATVSYCCAQRRG